jgi:hypothetical protein
LFVIKHVFASVGRWPGPGGCLSVCWGLAVRPAVTTASIIANRQIRSVIIAIWPFVVASGSETRSRWLGRRAVTFLAKISGSPSLAARISHPPRTAGRTFEVQEQGKQELAALAVDNQPHGPYTCAPDGRIT